MMRERIKQARKARHFSQKALADRIGISDAAMSKIETGVNNPARSPLISIASVLHVSLRWLETGEGEMEAETESQALDRIARSYSESRTFRALLDVYTQLNEDERATVDRCIRLLSEAVSQGEDPASALPTSEELARNAEALSGEDEDAAQIS